jgi:hypothetical protein
MITISQKLKNELWWMIISVDYDYSRIAIADYELNDVSLTLWLEDKQDFKNSLDDCLHLEIPVRQFGKIIRNENLNSYEGIKMHPVKKFLYKTRIEINEPVRWYQYDASAVEQQWAREAAVKTLLTQLVENDSKSALDW